MPARFKDAAMTICKHCKAFEPLDDSTGFCRMNLPQVNAVILERVIAAGEDLTAATTQATVWPIVADDDWCMEYLKGAA